MDSELRAKKLLELFERHARFAEVFFDGYALIDADAKILRSSPLFSRLTGVPGHLLLMADSIDEIMRLEISGVGMRMKEIIKLTKPTRLDEVKGITGKMHDHALTVSIYPFLENAELVGAFLMIRDVTASSELQSQYRIKSVLSVTDAMTGLFNRAYFDQYLSAQFAKYSDIPAYQDQRKMSLLMIDIDHFKKTNDTYGHLGGDHVIRELANVLKLQSRSTDIICRYGGEEFLAILPGAGLEGACAAAEKFRASIAEKPFIFEEKEILTTISVGISSIDFNTDTMAQALGRADAALYESKRAGRNRVTVSAGSADLNPDHHVELKKTS
jgi:diguanylate cyclase (GGDEF)-like protein